MPRCFQIDQKVIAFQTVNADAATMRFFIVRRHPCAQPLHGNVRSLSEQRGKQDRGEIVYVESVPVVLVERDGRSCPGARAPNVACRISQVYPPRRVLRWIVDDTNGIEIMLRPEEKVVRAGWDRAL